MNSNESEDWEGFSKNGSWENSIKSERWVLNFSESDAKDSSSKSQSWENWIDVWAGFWLEGVALPIVAIFGIIGEKHYWLNKPAQYLNLSAVNLSQRPIHTYYVENVFLKYEFSKDVFVGRLIDYAFFRNITSKENFQNVTRENSLLLLTPLWLYIKPDKFDKSFTAKYILILLNILKFTMKIKVNIFLFSKNKKIA